MSYRRAAQSGDPPPIDPELYERDDLRAAIAHHDFSTVYRALRDEQSLHQRRIADLTGQRQSEVSEILSGRQVLMYSVLRRIVTGLDIPPELAGLSAHDPADPDAYPGGVTVANTPEGVSPAMLRRHVIALGGLIMAGVPIGKAAELKVGQLLETLGALPPASLPSQLTSAHPLKVQDLTRRLAEAGNASICDPQVLCDAAARVSRLLNVPGPDHVVQALKVAVAELRIEAGWAALDAGLYRHALHHFALALELATDAGEPYCQATALHCAGTASIEHGHPDDGLKMLQCAQVAAWAIPRGERAVTVGPTGRAGTEATLLATTSTAFAQLGDTTTAGDCLAKGRQLWTPARTDTYGDPDRPAARLALTRGQLDLAEQLAAASVRRWEGGSLISRTQTGIVQATIYVTAGEPRGLQLAHDTITEVSKLGSVRVRTQLHPLADSLDTRPGTDAQDLARQARQVATTRA
ncbi:MAG: helix-turn-helix domain-containing protein [Pseudonocardiaceae bacterium]